MDHVTYFTNLFESIADYRKIVLLMFLNKNDVDLLNESGFLKRDFNCLYLEWEKKHFDGTKRRILGLN